MCKSQKIKFFIIFCIATLFASYWYLSNKNCNSSVVIYTVCDQSKLGEVNMVMSVAETVPQICKDWALLTHTADFKLISEKLDKSQINLIVTAGQYGIDFLKTTTPTKNVKFLLCVHQWFDAMKDLHDISLAIPKHAINDNITKWAQKQNIQLIPTQGVLHRMSTKALSSEDTSVIKLKDAKVGIILGGDAEMPNGKDWKLFSEKNAHEFSLEVCEFLKKTGYKILITNGPRTGAFKDINSRDPNAHKNGSVDKVSEAFLKTLIDAGFKQGEHFEFYDFQFGKPSALKAVMAIVQKNNGCLIAPGESISSISEAIAVMPTVVYKVDSMNAVHEAYLNDLLDSKVVSIWPNVPDASQSAYLAPESQAVAVVKNILK